MYRIFLTFLAVSFLGLKDSDACSVLYYVDPNTGKIYVANNEDYWYDVKPYIQIMPNAKGALARLWYGWDDFAQGGINEAGLFFDGAVTPEQKIPDGFNPPHGNLGDEILAACKTVDEAIAFLEKRKIALSNAHMMFGDSTGNAAVVEWVNGKRKIISISDNQLIMTNFLLSDPSQGNYPCYRYDAIEKDLNKLEEKEETVNLLKVGNTLGRAAQSSIINKEGRRGGTLYSTFINISDMEFFLVYQLDNSKITKLDLLSEFAHTKKRKIKLK